MRVVPCPLVVVLLWQLEQSPFLGIARGVVEGKMAGS